MAVVHVAGEALGRGGRGSQSESRRKSLNGRMEGDVLGLVFFSSQKMKKKSKRGRKFCRASATPPPHFPKSWFPMATAKGWRERISSFFFFFFFDISISHLQRKKKKIDEEEKEREEEEEEEEDHDPNLILEKLQEMGTLKRGQKK